MWLLMKICFFGYMIIKLVWHCLLLCILFQKKVTHLWGTLLCPFSSKMGYKLGYIVKLHTFETSVYFFSCLYSNKEYKIHVKRWMELLFWEDIFIYLTSFRPKDIPGGLVVKNPPAHTGDVGSIPGLGRSPEKEMATHSSILAWRKPWTEEQYYSWISGNGVVNRIKSELKSQKPGFCCWHSNHLTLNK